MKEKDVLVTGGAGFLGHHLCRKLDNVGYGVKVFDLRPNEEFKTTIGDLREKGSLELKEALRGVGAVIHLAGFIEAGESVQDPRKYVENNILGSFNLLEAMRETDVKKIIFSSSAAVYGEPTQVPIPESAPTYPVNTYGSTKAAVEVLMSSYAYNYGFSAIALRYFNLYGPGENHNPETHLIPRFIYMMKNNMDLTVWGDGQHKREYVYVEDIATAHILALGLNKGFEAINLSSGRGNSVQEVIYLISDILQTKPKIKYLDPRPGDPKILQADTQKAKKLLGWEAETKLEDGLKTTVDYFNGRDVNLG